MDDILAELLNNLVKMDESLAKDDINTALKYVHESMLIIKKQTGEN